MSKTLISTSDCRPIKMYERYGGLLQSQPLTDVDKEYDNACRAIDYAEQQLGTKSMSLFTADEFMWFSWFRNKVFWFPKQDQLDWQLIRIGALLKTIEARERGETMPDATKLQQSELHALCQGTENP